MSDEFTPTLSDQTQCLPRDVYGEQVRKAPQQDDSDLRALRVELYAERLCDGLDIWTGKPLPEANDEATRMPGVGSRPKCGGRRPKTPNGLIKVA